MIKYGLKCDNDHEFDGWFRSSDDFDKQVQLGFLDCPSCGSAKITKMLMAPAVTGTKKSQAQPITLDNDTGKTVEAPTKEVAQIPPQPVPAIPREVVEKIREIKKLVVENAENVGNKFTEEARKIHYGEAEARGIYGEAKIDDVKELFEEGIDIMPLPMLPEDHN